MRKHWHSRYVINEINYAVSLNKKYSYRVLRRNFCFLMAFFALCLQPFQSLEVNVEDWLPRALQALSLKLFTLIPT